MSPALPPPTATPPPARTPPPTGPAPSDHGAGGQPHRPLLVTGQPELLERLLRLTDAAAVEPTVALDPSTVRQGWVSAPLVVVGMDRAAACLAAGLPPRPRLVLIGDRTANKRVWEYGADLGADHVLFLPAAAGWLTAAFAEFCDADRTPCATIGVVAGRRGSGSSTLSVALALAALRNDLRTMLIDADPRGGGLEPGFTCLIPAVRDGGGKLGIDPGAGLPAGGERRGELSVITWDEQAGPELSSLAMTDLLATAHATSDLAVVDLPWQPDDAAAVAVAACRTVLLLVRANPQSVMTARRVATAISRHCADVRAVIRLDGTPPPGAGSSDAAPSDAGSHASASGRPPAQPQTPEQVGHALGVPVAGVLAGVPSAFDDQLLTALGLLDVRSAGGSGSGARP
ncbi:septum site-determining protein Ssd [Candidatus Frankia nodulisporulans]|uniref:septum site-determining protein Ssd n=1 Tax=Candidatus Frankia nodulisporulans TaxID=2060052 RepID=UPI0013D6A42F|nr:septum site-determining protein Ssd [Candidatus Frankia nodulisporulans]